MPLMRLSARKLLAITVISKSRLVPPSCQTITLVTPRRLGVQKQLVRADRRTLDYVSKSRRQCVPWEAR